MNAKGRTQEFVDLIKAFRNGQQESIRMPRWVAELELGCIPLEQPDVTRAHIEPIQIDRQAAYPARRVDPERVWILALQWAAYLPAPLVA